MLHGTASALQQVRMKVDLAWAVTPVHPYIRIGVYRGTMHNCSIMLNKPASTVGTASTNDILMDHPSIGEIHAVFAHDVNGQTYLIDLGTEGGTYLTDPKTQQQIKCFSHRPIPINEGSLIQLGTCRLYFVLKIEGDPDDEDDEVVADLTTWNNTVVNSRKEPEDAEARYAETSRWQKTKRWTGSLSATKKITFSDSVGKPADEDGHVANFADKVKQFEKDDERGVMEMKREGRHVHGGEQVTYTVETEQKDDSVVDEPPLKKKVLVRLRRDPYKTPPRLPPPKPKPAMAFYIFPPLIIAKDASFGATGGASAHPSSSTDSSTPVKRPISALGALSAY